MSFTFDAHKNFVSTAVATAPSPATSGLTFTVTTGGGSLFPAPPFNVAVYPAGVFPNALNTEIVRVTGVSTDTLTVTRQAESSASRSILTGDIVSLTITSKTVTDIETNLNTLSDTVTTNASAINASNLTSGTVPAARLPALTGDITTSAGSAATTLATVNSNVGAFGDATHVPAVTVNAKGLVTAAASTAITFPVTSVNSHTGVVTVTKSDVSLGNCDNTSDANKPVSTATQTALDLKANLASPTFTGTVAGITKSMVGLGNVENTALSTWAGTSSITTVGTLIAGSLPLSLTTGTLPETKGGTGITTLALGDIFASSATNVLSKVAGNTSATKKFLSQTGTGSVSALPAWVTLAESDITGLTTDLTAKLNVTDGIATRLQADRLRGVDSTAIDGSDGGNLLIQGGQPTEDNNPGTITLSGTTAINLTANPGNATQGNITLTTTNVGYIDLTSDGQVNITSSNADDITIGSDGGMTLSTNNGNDFNVNSNAGVNLSSNSGDNVTIVGDGDVNINTNSGSVNIQPSDGVTITSNDAQDIQINSDGLVNITSGNSNPISLASDDVIALSSNNSPIPLAHNDALSFTSTDNAPISQNTGYVNTDGDSACSRVVCRALQTAYATAPILKYGDTGDNGSFSFVVPEQSVTFFTVRIAAIINGTIGEPHGHGFTLNAIVKRFAGSTTISQDCSITYNVGEFSTPATMPSVVAPNQLANVVNVLGATYASDLSAGQTFHSVRYTAIVETVTANA